MHFRCHSILLCNIVPFISPFRFVLSVARRPLHICTSAVSSLGKNLTFNAKVIYEIYRHEAPLLQTIEKACSITSFRLYNLNSTKRNVRFVVLRWLSSVTLCELFKQYSQYVEYCDMRPESRNSELRIDVHC
jgi:hypothetical protein